MLHLHLTIYGSYSVNRMIMVWILISNLDVFLEKHFRMLFRILEMMYLVVIQIQVPLLHQFQSIWKQVYEIMILLTLCKESVIPFMVIDSGVIVLVISTH